MSSSPRARDRSSYGWAVLLVALSLEAFGGLVLLLQTANGMLSATEEPLAMRLSIFIALLIAWVWVAATLLGGWRSRASWARGSALTIHVLLFAAATGMLQLRIGGQGLAWALVILAFAGFIAAILARPSYEEAAAD